MKAILASTLSAVLWAAPALATGPVYFPGRWQLTEYWITEERGRSDAETAVSIPSRTGTIAMSCPSFLTDLTMEGTGRTWDNRLLNWESRTNGHACFQEVDQDSYPFGVGVQGYALVPYRSLAVDRRFLPIGHTVEMPELAGLPLPDGTRHDGCFVAVDGGGAINGHHIDLFLPSATMWRTLSRQGFLPSHVRQVVLDSPRCEYARRFALVPDSRLPAFPR